MTHKIYHCSPLILSQWWVGLWDCRHPAACCLVQTLCQRWTSWEAPEMHPVCSLSRCHGSRPLRRPACSPSSFLSGWGDDISPPLWRCRSPLAFRVYQAYCSKKRKRGVAKDKDFILYRQEMLYVESDANSGPSATCYLQLQVYFFWYMFASY